MNAEAREMVEALRCVANDLTDILHDLKCGRSVEQQLDSLRDYVRWTVAEKKRRDRKLTADVEGQTYWPEDYFR